MILDKKSTYACIKVETTTPGHCLLVNNLFTGPPRCGLGQMIDTSDGLFVLVFVLVLGILIGLASNIAICLIFPKIHRYTIDPYLYRVQTKLICRFNLSINYSRR